MFKIVFTTLKYVSTDFPYSSTAPLVLPVEVLAEPQEFEGVEVGIPLSDGRDAQFTMSIFNPALGEVVQKMGYAPRAYETGVMIWHYQRLVFRGIVVYAQWRLRDGKVTFFCRDSSERLEGDIVHDGDEARQVDNGYGGHVPVDYRGLRVLRDAATNTPQQNGRGDPVLGVGNGPHVGGTEDVTIEVERGAQVWSSMKEIASHTIGPDFELVPIEEDDDSENYCHLRTWSPYKGVDRTLNGDPADRVLFSIGFQKDNAEDAEWKQGGKLFTHARIFTSNNKLVITSHDDYAAGFLGHRVYTDTTEYKATNTDAIKAYADAIVGAYSLPPDYITVTLHRDDDSRSVYRYIEHFDTGDIIMARIRKGYFDTRASEYQRIMKVTLTQENQTRHSRTSIDIVPWIGDTFPGDDEG